MASLGKSSVLVTGGTGYIGRHTVDALSTGEKKIVLLTRQKHVDLSVYTRRSVKVYVGDIADSDLISYICSSEGVDLVMHFAGEKLVSNFTSDPLSFWVGNFSKTILMLQALYFSGVRQVVFSSSCAVYGGTDDSPTDESRSKNPISTYGQAKLAVEHALESLSSIDKDFRYVSLRYFNPAGVDVANKKHGLALQSKNVIEAAIKSALGIGPTFNVYDHSHGAKDGTMVRDYVHISDVVEANLLAARYLKQGGLSFSCNVGTGIGTSVLELLRVVESVLQREVPRVAGAQRPFDPGIIYANNALARTALGWLPKNRLESMVASEYEWISRSSSISL